MQIFYSVDIVPSQEEPGTPPAALSDDERALSAELAKIRGDRTVFFAAFKRLQRCQPVELEAARMIAAAMLWCPPVLTGWELRFLWSALRWRQQPTKRQLQKLRQISRNPMPLAALIQRIVRCGQRSLQRRHQRSLRHRHRYQEWR